MANIIDHSKWIAEDGLMSMSEGVFHPPYNTFFTHRVDNENGIMCLVLAMTLFEEFHQYYNQAMRNTESVALGLFHRHPGGDATTDCRINSHDNMVAAAVGAIMTGDTQWFLRLIKHYPILNDQKPNGWWWNRIVWKKYTPSGIHSPADWGIYTLAAGKGMNWFRFLFLMGKLIYDAKKNTGTHHINYLRKFILTKFDWKFSWLQRWVAKKVVAYHTSKINDYWHLYAYFGQVNNPIQIEAKKRYDAGLVK